MSSSCSSLDTSDGGAPLGRYRDPDVQLSDGARSAATANSVAAYQNSIASAQSRHAGAPATDRRLPASNTPASQSAAVRPSRVLVRAHKPLPDSVAAQLATISLVPRRAHEVNDAVAAYSRLSRSCSQANLATFFRERILLSSQSPALATQVKSSWSLPLARHLTTVCSQDGQPLVKVPSPQLLCGYSSEVADGAFASRHIAAHEQLQPSIFHYTWANSQGLSFPFLAVEFAAPSLPTSRSSGTSESLSPCYVACTAGVKLARRLNTVARRRRQERLNRGHSDIGALACVPEICHGVVVNQNTADVYVVWSEELSKGAHPGERGYYVQCTQKYLLSKPEHMDKFIGHVHGIVAWGIHERLIMIRSLLDVIG